jgi:hypothetical protein
LSNLSKVVRIEALFGLVPAYDVAMTISHIQTVSVIQNMHKLANSPLQFTKAAASILELDNDMTST